MKTILILTTAALLMSGCGPLNSTVKGPVTGAHHYVEGYAPISEHNLVQVIVEIPAGTTQKWEVDKSDGKIHWEIEDGTPRIVKYLGYPGNYGMVPRTLVSYETGGDGDPLDVIVLGPAVERGSVINTKVIGVLKLVDKGEQDDKLVAVLEGTSFYNVDSIDTLNRQFPGVSSIVETWFENYKGPGKMKSLGYAEAQEANAVLQTAIDAYAFKINGKK